jgi:hypothetical protein
MSKREPLMTEAFFVDSLHYIDKTVESRTTKLREQPEVYKKPVTFLRANLRDRYQQIFIGYSLDEDAPRLAARFPAVVEAYETYLRDPKATPTDLQDLDDYIVSLWLVSLAIVLRVDDALWQRLLACIGNEGRDALFDALVETRSPGRKKAAGLLHPAIFEPLLNAISAQGESRDAFVRRYLRDWYKSFKPAYWVDSHKGPDGGGFFGYWAMEVAGVVTAFHMDDRAFSDLPYYPRDLVA